MPREPAPAQQVTPIISFFEKKSILTLCDKNGMYICQKGVPLIISNAKYVTKNRISLLTIWAFLVIFINNSTRHAIPFFGSGPRRVFLFLGGFGEIQ